jgi:alanine racemase
MDYCTVDVGHVPDVQLGDTVTFIGKQGRECLRVQDLAEAAGTIPYEITCSLSGRVHRVLTHAQAPMVSSIR